MEHDRYTEFFCPPLWRQRRIFIQDTLARFNIETVLDYGCGEAAVLSFLIPESDPPIKKMAGIDICDDVLAEAIDRCTPWQTDYEQLRNHPLSVDIYKGSIGDPDERFLGFDGIICTEVIEHVFTPVLDSFLSITLGLYQPRILIVTTPNGEYNVNFPDLKYGTEQSVFRHDDHKFEWTRKQFEGWCHEGAIKYNYNVEFHGIGLLHGKYDDLENGHCTQACIFTRGEPEAKAQILSRPHQHLKHLEFPFFNEPPPPKDQIIQEVLHYIEALCISEHKVNETRQSHAYGQEEKIVIDLDIDWTNFNLEEVIIPGEDLVRVDQAKHTKSPIHLPISSLWHILRVRQLFETQDKLVQLLQTLDPQHFEIHADTIKVKVQYKVDDTDTHSVMTHSSRDSW